MAEEELLRRRAPSHEPVTLETMIEASGLIGLDRKTCVLAQIAALVATEPRVSSYEWAIDAAIAHGATEEEIIDVLLSIAPIVGWGHVTSAARALAQVIGYDVARRSGEDEPDPRARSLGTVPSVHPVGMRTPAAVGARRRSAASQPQEGTCERDR